MRFPVRMGGKEISRNEAIRLLSKDEGPYTIKMLSLLSEKLLFEELLERFPEEKARDPRADDPSEDLV